ELSVIHHAPKSASGRRAFQSVLLGSATNPRVSFARRSSRPFALGCIASASFPSAPIGREGPIRMVGGDESSGTPFVARRPRNHPHPKSGGAADRHRAHADGLGTADVERGRRGRPAG